MTTRPARPALALLACFFQTVFALITASLLALIPWITGSTIGPLAPAGQVRHWKTTFTVSSALLPFWIALLASCLLLWLRRRAGWYLAIATDLLFLLLFTFVLFSNLNPLFHHHPSIYSPGLQRLVLIFLAITAAPLLLLVMPQNRCEYLRPAPSAASAIS